MNDFKKTISIRLKIIIIVLVNIVILIASLYFISTIVISKSYLDIENAEMVKELGRSSDAIGNNISQLTAKLKDWAFWDDTYKFVQDKNKAYIESNLGAVSISNLKINLMAFFNAKGDLVIEKTIDLNTIKEIDSESGKDTIALSKKLTVHETIDSMVEGLIMFPEGPIIVSSVPVLNSAGEGPIQGSLIFGIFLDDKMVKSLEELTHLSLKLYDFNSRSLPADVSDAKLEIFKGKDKYFIKPISNDAIVGYKVLDDIYGNPILILKVDSPRVLYNQAQNSLYLFIVVSSIMTILFGFILIFLIKKFITSRLLLLSEEVKKINEKGDLSIRVKEGARDEIGFLAMTINNIFGTLSFSKKLEEEAKEKIEANDLVLKNNFEQTNRMNKLMVGRELEMIKLKKEIEELKNNK